MISKEFVQFQEKDLALCSIYRGYSFPQGYCYGSEGVCNLLL